jgi:hypothetical protein
MQLAWARTRYWQYTDGVYDGIALRLYELDVGGRNKRLFDRLLQKSSLPFKAADDHPYDVPKSEGEYRPRVLSNLESQIAGASATGAVSNLFETQFKQCGDCSYAYHLNLEVEDEYFYKDWYQLHKSYREDILRRIKEAKRGAYFRGDIAKFYNHISQETLCHSIASTLPARENLIQQVCNQCIKVQCRGSESHFGLRQGHLLSGFFSNVYLMPLDRNIASRWGYRDDYFRYVDDIVALGESIPEMQDLRDRLVARLAEPDLRLELNSEKSTCGSARDLSALLGQDPILDDLSERTQRILRPLYRLHPRAVMDFVKHEHQFVAAYRSFLQQIGIYINPAHLRRKLRQENAWLRQWIPRTGSWNFWRWYHKRVIQIPFTWPGIYCDMDARTLGIEAKQFLASNHDWQDIRDRLGRDLLAMLKQAIDEVSSSLVDATAKKRAISRIRFAVKRLSMIRCDQAIPTLEELLQRPWLVDTVILTKTLARYERYDMLIKVIESEMPPFVRSMSAAALGDERCEQAIESLWRMVRSADTTMERLQASEALVKINRWDLIPPNELLEAWRQEQNPSVVKNLAICIALAALPRWEDALRERWRPDTHQSILDAIWFALNNPAVCPFDLPEVDPPRFSERYPDLEPEPLYYIEGLGLS